MVMLELGGEGWWYGWGFGEEGGQGLAAGVSHLCQGSGFSGGVSPREGTLSSPAARQSTSAPRFLPFPSPFYQPSCFFPILSASHTLLPCSVYPSSVWQPPALLFESWKERSKERERESKGGEWGKADRSDRVSALSEAFHHIFVAVCTPALQTPHSKLLLLLCILLCMVPPQPMKHVLQVLWSLLLQPRESERKTPYKLS